MFNSPKFYVVCHCRCVWLCRCPRRCPCKRLTEPLKNSDFNANEKANPRQHSNLHLQNPNIKTDEKWKKHRTSKIRPGFVSCGACWGAECEAGSWPVLEPCHAEAGCAPAACPIAGANVNVYSCLDVRTCLFRWMFCPCEYLLLFSSDTDFCSCFDVW